MSLVRALRDMSRFYPLCSRVIIPPVNALTLATLREFWEAHPDAEEPLRRWLGLVRRGQYRSFAEVRADFGEADWVRGFIVFDIGGNKYRVVAEPDFETQRLYIKHILTHKGYDAWTKEMRSK